MRSLLVTWTGALYEILSAEDWWLKANTLSNVTSKAFESQPRVLATADCTNVNCEGSSLSELIRQLLYSKYYGHCCGKFCVVTSRIGGTLAVSRGMGGPAGDHRCMEAAGLFEPAKWEVKEGESKAELLYDAGVSAKTKTVAQAAGFDVVTSGIVRKSAESSLSGRQRGENFKISSLRIRVENFIGIVKQHFRILCTTRPFTDLPIMSKMVYVCFMLHNFGTPIIQ